MWLPDVLLLENGGVQLGNPNREGNSCSDISSQHEALGSLPSLRSPCVP